MKNIFNVLLLASCAYIGTAATDARSPTSLPSSRSSSPSQATNLQASSPLKSRSTSTTHTEYLSYAQTAFEVLQNTWYNKSTGLWDNQWWNSANGLKTLVELRGLDTSIESTAQVVYSNMYAQAPIWNLHNFGGVDSFINSYYDDEGWWALAWIKVYDQTQESNISSGRH